MRVSCPQIGKSISVAVWAIGMACMVPTYMPAKTHHVGWWAAPTYDIAEIGFHILRNKTREAGLFAGSRSARGAQEVRLVNGVKIRFKSWDREEGLTSETVHFLVVDEAQHLTERVWDHLEARLSATQGPIRVIGNSGDVNGQFKVVCDQAADPADDLSSFNRWTWRDRLTGLGGAGTSEGAAYLEFINRQRLKMTPLRFEAIYEAAWTTPGDGIFFGVDKATRIKPETKAEGRYVVGWDIGKIHDYTAGVVIRVDTKPPRAVAMKRFRRKSHPETAHDIVKFCGKWRDALAIIETNGPGEAILDMVRDEEYPCKGHTTTGKNKSPDFEETAGAIANETLLLAPLPPLQSELKTIIRMASMKIGAPEPLHDDCGVALVIGYVNRNASMGSITVGEEQPGGIMAEEF